MKMSPEYVKAQENMQPGVITADGFLGDEDRPLVDIIESDEEEMRRIGLDWDEVADRLQHLLSAGREGLGEPVTVDRWVVRVDEARGFLASPFEDGVFRKVNAIVCRAAAPQRELTYTELSLHLLRKYHFLEGRGAPFRLEPARIREVLGESGG